MDGWASGWVSEWVGTESGKEEVEFGLNEGGVVRSSWFGLGVLIRVVSWSL